jgi:hypothetical protein
MRHSATVFVNLENMEERQKNLIELVDPRIPYGSPIDLENEIYQKKVG